MYNQNKPRNILFLLADDLGYWGLGCTGNSEMRTPHIDRLAREGVLLDNAFCVSPVCSPARASILTGTIPSAHGVHDWIRRGNSPREEDGAIIDYLAGQTTYVEILARHGYECGLSGKWHLGAVGTPAPGHTFWKAHAAGGGSYYNAPVMNGEKVVTEPRYITDVIADQAVEFLNTREDDSRPFYLGVHYTAPHSPWERDQHPAEIYGSYHDHCPFQSVPERAMHAWQINSAPWGYPETRREILSGYFTATTAMDGSIGRILETLERRGELDSTLVICTSDNGMNMGHHGIYGKGNGTYPQNMFDTSVKVPFIFRCPAGFPSGQRLDGLHSHYDLFPTLLDYADLNAEKPEGLPGRSRLAEWQGISGSEDAPIVVFDEYGPVRMIRTREWKYIHRFPDGPHELYHLADDPGEETNLVEHDGVASIREEMQRDLREWFRRYVTPGRDGSRLPVTGKGQMDRCENDNAFAHDWNYLSSNAPAKL